MDHALLDPLDYSGAALSGRVLRPDEVAALAALETTPGPWVIEDEGEIRTEDGCLIARVHPHGNIRTVLKLGETYSVADQRLAAASPDLLATAQRVGPLEAERDALRAEVARLQSDRDAQREALRSEVAALRHALAGRGCT